VGWVLARSVAASGYVPCPWGARAGIARLGYNPGVAAEAPPPGWTLISVLFSSLPLSATLAATLHQAAVELYRRDEATGPVAGDLVNGRVVNLKKTMQLGAISGPAFEARLDTERGSGTVRYLLTRQGLDLLGVPEPAPRAAAPRYLN
jgi:hypothetical protein